MIAERELAVARRLPEAHLIGIERAALNGCSGVGELDGEDLLARELREEARIGIAAEVSGRRRRRVRRSHGPYSHICRKAAMTSARSLRWPIPSITDTPCTCSSAAYPKHVGSSVIWKARYPASR